MEKFFARHLKIKESREESIIKVSNKELRERSGEGLVLSDIVKGIESLPPKRRQIILNFLKASRINQKVTRRYNVVLEWNEPDEEDPEGGYTVLVPSLPPVVTQGHTREEALANALEAIECYLEYLVLTDEQIPESDTSGENLVEVTV